MPTVPYRPSALHRLPAALAALAVLTVLLGTLAAPATYAAARPASASASYPVEPYASYVGESTCSPTAKPGTVYLGGWLVRAYGGGFGRITEPCSRSVSEHQEGRAFDWMNDARSTRDRYRVQAFLHRIFATDAAGNPHAVARRMGIMYLIWNDRIYSSYRGFAPRPYLSSSCARLSTCSATLRHRDHVHISLSWAGALERTSWYWTQGQGTPPSTAGGSGLRR